MARVIAAKCLRQREGERDQEKARARENSTLLLVYLLTFPSSAEVGWFTNMKQI